MNLATTISDGALALTSFALARSLVVAAGAPAARRALRGAALGLGLMGAAALVGALRFAGLEELAPIHRGLTDAATAITMPMMGAAALTLAWPLQWSARAWSRWLGLLVVLFVAARLAGAFAIHGLVIGAVGTGGVLVAGLRVVARLRAAGVRLLVGAVLVLIAGLAVGSEGELGPFARIDVFHYLLALADLALVAGLLGLARASAKGRG